MPGQQYGDPIPRSATANSMHSGVRVGHPRHANTMPPGAGEGNWSQGGYPAKQGQYYERDTTSMYSVQSGYSNHSSGYDASESHAHPQYDTDASSIYSGDGRPRQYGLPPRPTPNPNRQYYPQQGPPQHGQWAAPVPYDPIALAASDVLGLSPPPSAVGGPPQSAYYPNPGHPNPGQYQQSYNDYSDTASIRSGGSRPPINRGGTENFSNLGTRKTKAVDVNQPPFTKEYVDQYRQRIKADPDPEAHFAYAKYLIEAAKKIGSGASDQRAVRKYRDTLITESLKVIRRLATQGDAYSEAQFFLASCYGVGMLGLQMDHERAYHLYLQAAKQNHAAACYRVAVCNEKGAGTKKEPRRAVAFYRKAASLGDTAAMYKLGMILLTGALEQEKKEREAIPWLKRAAEQADEENPHALHELGLLHATPNHLVVHDEAYAKDLFTKAAQLGYTQSQYKLGSCYEYGTLTCPVDPRRSIAWYTKAAEKGDSEAELALSGWYLTGSEGVLQQNDEEAFLWARRAANKGLSKAEYAVGYYTEVGIGTKASVEEAKRWYMRAAG